MKKLEFRKVSAAPAPGEGEALASTGLTASGKALYLFVRDDPSGEVHAREDSGIGNFPVPRMKTAKAFRLVVLDAEGGCEDWTIPPVDLAFPRAQLFPDGRILLAATRAVWRGEDDYDLNGVIYDPTTGSVQRILLGDGIADISVDAAGRIWVSYFDEGIFGNFGWDHPGPPGPGAGGLVCFAPDGKILWRFNGPDADDSIADCYAMNAAPDGVWICYYTDFSLCRIAPDFSRTYIHQTHISGASAFAIHDEAVLFSHQYDEAPDTMHLAHRKGSGLQRPHKIRAALPDGTDIAAANLIGCGSDMHVLSNTGWFTANLQDLL